MKYQITKVGVLGASVMGAGIAGLIAGAGIPVVMLDIVPKELNEDEIKNGISKDSKAHRNRFAKVGKDRISDRKTGVLYSTSMANYITIGNLEDDLALLSDCDWIIEVVAENLAIKQNLFKNILPYVKENTILSTNTSGIPIADIAKFMPGHVSLRFLGTHFFNPPRYMRLVEIIPHKGTDSDVLIFMKQFCYNILGKGVVDAKDTPNFIANRIGSVMTPAISPLMEKYGFDFETVDYLTGPLIGNPKTGTFKLLDMVGFDIAAHVNDNLRDALSDEKEKAIFEIPSFLKDMISIGMLGDKTKGGFYKKIKNEKGEKSTLVWDPKKRSYKPTTKISIPFVEEVKKQKRLKDRLQALVYSDEPAGKFLWDYLKFIILYSARCVPEVADTYHEIDKAMKWGYNWGAGPFEIWEMIGFAKAAEKIQAEGEHLSDWILERIAQGKKLYEIDPDFDSFSNIYSVVKKYRHSTLLNMGDGVLGVELHAPGNSVTDTMVEELNNTMDMVENTPDYKGLVLLSSANNFLNGANLVLIGDLVQKKDYAALEKIITDFQKITMRFKYAKKPIVAAVHGMVLGGGMEVAIHSSRVVAHADTYMGLVEAGVGLIPGGGGAKELLLRLSEQAKNMGIIDTASMVKRNWQNVATAVVSKNAFQAKELGYLLSTDVIVMQIDLLAERAKEEVINMSKDFRQKFPGSTVVTGKTGFADIESVVYAMVQGNFISEYDAVVSKEIAKAFTGGNVPKGTVVSEAELLHLERIGFVRLCHNEKTLERIIGMVATGKAVRN